MEELAPLLAQGEPPLPKPLLIVAAIFMFVAIMRLVAWIGMKKIKNDVHCEIKHQREMQPPYNQYADSEDPAEREAYRDLRRDMEEDQRQRREHGFEE